MSEHKPARTEHSSSGLEKFKTATRSIGFCIRESVCQCTTTYKWWTLGRCYGLDVVCHHKVLVFLKLSSHSGRVEW